MVSLLDGRRDCAEFVRREDGAGTVLNLLLLVSMVAVGGLAVDVTNVTASRTELQITADAVAHAALLSRETMIEYDAKVVALALSDKNLPIQNVGEVIAAEDIVFGYWNEITRAFVADADSRSGVQVTARQSSDAGNPIATFMLKVVGFDEWDVAVSATFITYHPTCLREGFVAEGVVDLQSGNSYSNGFCIHSNEYVSLNSNNYFEAGTVVSMSNLADIDLPNSGYDSNEGLKDALREGAWNIRIISRIDDIIAGVKDPNSDYYPDYLTSSAVIVLDSVKGANPSDTEIKNYTIEDVNLKTGRIHQVTCSKPSENLTIGNNVVVESVVIYTNCPVTFNAGVVVRNAVIVTTSTSSTSFKAPSGLTLGLDDDCRDGGAAQLVTMGSMNFASDLSIFGSQLLAVGNISFSANAGGLEGASMVAGGVISGTSNMVMGSCGDYDLDNFQVSYFKMVN